MMLKVSSLSVTLGGQKIVDDVSFEVGPRQWLMIVGPNGAGKSTIINAISQGLAYDGRVLIDGADARGMRPQLLARNIGVLSQSNYVGYSFTVGEVAGLGRYAYSRGFFNRGENDGEMVRRALTATGMLELEGQSVMTLSGGELQRTFLAQLFAQDPKLLLLDEPTNHLDLVYQKQMFELISEWIDQTGRSVVSVVHDLSLARAYSTHAILLDKGRTVSCGSTRDVLTRKNLEAVYSIDVYEWMRGMLSQWQE